MSDCANGGRGRWADARWHAPMEMPAPRHDGTDVLTVQTLHSSSALESASRVLLVDDENKCGYLFVAAKRRDWDDCEVD